MMFVFTNDETAWLVSFHWLNGKVLVAEYFVVSSRALSAIPIIVQRPAKQNEIKIQKQIFFLYIKTQKKLKTQG